MHLLETLDSSVRGESDTCLHVIAMCDQFEYSLAIRGHHIYKDIASYLYSANFAGAARSVKVHVHDSVDR